MMHLSKGTRNGDQVELREQVFATLNHALANGYSNLIHFSPMEVADDIHEYDADLADADVEEMIPHVKAWQDEQVENGLDL
jgi:hypothetical protein